MAVRTLIVKPAKGHEYDGLATENEGVAVIEICHKSENYLDTVFHECFHIHQYTNGIVKQEYGGFNWRGIFIPTFIYSMLHPIIPFEVSAKAYARKMCRRLEKL